MRPLVPRFPRSCGRLGRQFVSWAGARAQEGKRVPAMAFIANGPTMSAPLHEVSVWFALAMTEYLTEMGYKTALLADSLPYWADALRQVGARQK